MNDLRFFYLTQNVWVTILFLYEIYDESDDAQIPAEGLSRKAENCFISKNSQVKIKSDPLSALGNQLAFN